MLSADNLVILAIALIVLGGQTVLCFWVRRFWVRLIPGTVCLSGALLLGGLGCVLEGWDALGCFLCSLFALVLGVLCGLPWGIWGIAQGIAAISRRIKNRKEKK